MEDFLSNLFTDSFTRGVGGNPLGSYFSNSPFDIFNRQQADISSSDPFVLQLQTALNDFGTEFQDTTYNSEQLGMMKGASGIAGLGELFRMEAAAAQQDRKRAFRDHTQFNVAPTRGFFEQGGMVDFSNVKALYKDNPAIRPQDKRPEGIVRDTIDNILDNLF